MDPATLTTLAQQATDILVPALSFSIICEEGKAVAGKAIEIVKGRLYEEAVDKLGSESVNKAKALMKKISPRMSESLEKAFRKAAGNSKDPEAKEELQQEILKLLKENPDLAREINITMNFSFEIEQFAVGNYNNFFKFVIEDGDTFSDEFLKIAEYIDSKRKETANQEILGSYNPSTLPNYPDKLKRFVNENRAEELANALKHIENQRILLLSGIGGVGKSTLERALVDFRPFNVPEPFWFDFNKNQDAKLGDIFEKLASYMNAPELVAFKTEKRDPGKIDVDRLTDELQKRTSLWLIFDDLNSILKDRHFRDEGLNLLFSALRYNTHNAKILITSRDRPILNNGEYLINVLEKEENSSLKGLKPEFAADYLSKNGLSKLEPQKLEELAKGVDGHPLALNLLIGLVKEFGVEDTLEDLSMYRESKEKTIIKAKKLFDKLAGDEKELLERSSVYCEPVGMKGLKEMFTEKTPNNSIRKLLDKSLLETDHKGTYWLHPLVQEFSYDDIKDKKAAHMLAVKYYLTLPRQENPSKKEDVQQLIEAHHQACMAEKYDLAAIIIGHTNLSYLLDLWGNSRTLIEIYEKMLPEDFFKDEPLLRDKQIHGAVLGNLGLAYSRLGETRKAIEYYEQALKISNEIGDRHREGTHLENLGIAYSYLGETGKAIEYYEQALKIVRGVGDRCGESMGLVNLGRAYNHPGDLEKAIEYFKRALKVSKEIEDQRGESIGLGNLGDTYIYLEEPEKAIEYYEQSLKIAREIGDRHGESADLGNLGGAYNHLEEPEKAIEYYEQALKISKEIEDRRGEGIGLENLGSTYGYLGETKKAIEHLEKSLAIGREIEDPRIIQFCEQQLNSLEAPETDLKPQSLNAKAKKWIHKCFRI